MGKQTDDIISENKTEKFCSSLEYLLADIQSVLVNTLIRISVFSGSGQC